jgi:hypothetical protein
MVDFLCTSKQNAPSETTLVYAILTKKTTNRYTTQTERGTSVHDFLSTGEGQIQKIVVKEGSTVSEVCYVCVCGGGGGCICVNLVLRCVGGCV